MFLAQQLTQDVTLILILFLRQPTRTSLNLKIMVQGKSGL